MLIKAEHWQKVRFLSPVQKSISKRVEVAKGLFRIHCEGIARDDSFHLSIHECSEAVSGRLWPNSATGKILLYEIPEGTTTTITDIATPNTSVQYIQQNTCTNLQF